MVDVPIDDQDAVQFQLVDGQPGRDGYVVEQAEAHCSVGERVMTGRTDQTQRPAVFTTDDSLGRIADGSGSHQGHIVRSRPDHRIGFQIAAPEFRQFRNFVDVGGRMNPRKTPTRNGLKRRTHTPTIESGSGKPIGDRTKPPGVFRVMPRVVLQENGFAIQ